MSQKKKLTHKRRQLLLCRHRTARWRIPVAFINICGGLTLFEGKIEGPPYCLHLPWINLYDPYFCGDQLSP